MLKEMLFLFIARTSNLLLGFLFQVLAVVLPLDEKIAVSTVVKPLEPVIIDLSDDDEDDCPEVTVKSPVKTAPKTEFCENFQKIATVSQSFLIFTA